MLLRLRELHQVVDLVGDLRLVGLLRLLLLRRQAVDLGIERGGQGRRHQLVRGDDGEIVADHGLRVGHGRLRGGLARRRAEIVSAARFDAEPVAEQCGNPVRLERRRRGGGGQVRFIGGGGGQVGVEAGEIAIGRVGLQRRELVLQVREKSRVEDRRLGERLDRGLLLVQGGDLRRQRVGHCRVGRLLQRRDLIGETVLDILIDVADDLGIRLLRGRGRDLRQDGQRARRRERTEGRRGRGGRGNRHDPSVMRRRFQPG